MTELIDALHLISEIGLILMIFCLCKQISDIEGRIHELKNDLRRFESGQTRNFFDSDDPETKLRNERADN